MFFTRYRLLCQPGTLGRPGSTGSSNEGPGSGHDEEKVRGPEQGDGVNLSTWYGCCITHTRSSGLRYDIAGEPLPFFRRHRTLVPRRHFLRFQDGPRPAGTTSDIAQNHNKIGVGMDRGGCADIL